MLSYSVHLNNGWYNIIGHLDGRNMTTQTAIPNDFYLKEFCNLGNYIKNVFVTRKFHTCITCFFFKYPVFMYIKMFMYVLDASMSCKAVD